MFIAGEFQFQNVSSKYDGKLVLYKNAIKEKIIIKIDAEIINILFTTGCSKKLFFKFLYIEVNLVSLKLSINSLIFHLLNKNIFTITHKIKIDNHKKYSNIQIQ